MWYRLILGWVLRFIVAPAAVIIIVALALFFLTACGSQIRLADGSSCERVEIDGETDYIAVYWKQMAWWLSAPGESSFKVGEDKVLTIDKDAQLAVIAFLDSNGKAQARAYNWHVRGEQKRFCLK